MEAGAAEVAPPPHSASSPSGDRLEQNSSLPTAPVSKTAHINFELLSNYFHLPMKEVALELGVCTTMLKRLCRNHGIPRWPFRQIKSINRMIKSMEKTKEAKSADSQRILKALEQKRRLLLTQPQPSTAPPVPENPRVKKITQYTFVPTSNSQAPMEIVSEVHNVPSPEEEVVVPNPPSSEPSPPFIFAPPATHTFSFTAPTAALPTFNPRPQQGFVGGPAPPQSSSIQSEAALRHCLAEIQQFIQQCDELYKQGKSEGSLLQQSQQQLLAQQQQEQLIHRTFVSLKTLQDQLSSRLRQPRASFDISEQTLVAQQLHHLRAQLQSSVRRPQFSSPSQQDSYMQRQPSAAASLQQQQHQHQQHQRQMALQQQQLQQQQQQQQLQHQQQQQLLAQRSMEQQRQRQLEAQSREEDIRRLKPLSHSQLMPTKRSVSEASSDYMDVEPDAPSKRNSWSKETFRQSMRDEIEQQHQLYIEQLHSGSSSSRSSSRSPPSTPNSKSPPSTPLPMPTTTSSSVRTFNAPHIPRKPASTTTLSSSSGSLPRASVHVSRELSPTSLLAARRSHTHGVMKSPSPPERRMPDVMELASSNFLSSRVMPSSMERSSHSSGGHASRDFSRMESPSSSSMRGFGGLEPARSFSGSDFRDRSHLAIRDQFHAIKLPELKLPEEHRNILRPKIATLEPTYRSKSPGP